VPIMRAILLRQCVAHLVTDERTAQSLLAAGT